MAENLPHRAAATAPMAATEWVGELPDRLRSALPDIPLRFLTYLRQNFIEAQASDIVTLLRHLQIEERFDMLTDLTAVDHPSEEQRFEVLYFLYSFAGNERVRIKIRAAGDQAVRSSTTLFAAANWLEREVFDMFGIRFSDHPDLKRILMPEDWRGFPLRKEKSITDMDTDWVHRNLSIESAQS